MAALAYYNEIDPDAVLILRELIADGVIAPGEIDTRSITEVQPNDLRGFTQCHFFAGGGLWSVAARMAGWPDDRPIWTASCPCQPFSVAGKGAGTDDARHLWPDLLRLASACRPAVVVGEQVAGKAGYGWLDGVRADLAGEGYASRGVDIPACAVDAPHIRQRLYWVALADADDKALRAEPGELAHAPCEHEGAPSGQGWNGNSPRHADGADLLVDAAGERRSEGRPEPVVRSGGPTAASADASGVTPGDAFSERLEGQRRDGDSASRRTIEDRSIAASDVGSHIGRNGSWWSDHEWIACHDGKARRTKPGVPLLVDGLSGRVALWRVAGNAISPVLAAEVIGALKDELDAERLAA